MQSSDPPRLVILAGPNGAGKTTAAEYILRDALAVEEFVNADVIAKGLSGFAPEAASIAAGRLMLARLHDLSAQRRSFAFETTLASRTFAPWIAALIREHGYSFHVVFLWLPSAEFALDRVEQRVQSGGHDVPETTIRRRYRRGLSNFLHLYSPMADSWLCYDNSRTSPRLVAHGGRGVAGDVLDPDSWATILDTDHEEREAT